jgi:hypothetical protein
MLSTLRERARVFGSRVRELNVSIGSGSETTTTIGKMSAEEIAVVNGTGVLGWWQDLHDQTSIATGTIETEEIGRTPIGDGRTAIGLIASGSPALLGRRYHAIESATIATAPIGNAQTVGMSIGTARTALRSPIPPDRQYRATETVTVATEKIGGVLIVTAQTVSAQIESDDPTRQGRKHGRIIKVGSGQSAENGRVRKVKELP